LIKKTEYINKGIKLYNHKANENIGITTMAGKFDIRRTVLNNRQSEINVYPLDEYLRINKLPYKVTKRVMSKVAFYAQNQGSFDKTSMLFKEEFGVEIGGSLVRDIAEAVGKKVFEKDTLEAEAIYQNMHKIQTIPETEKEDITLYIMTDGGALNTRVEDKNGSTWREAKLVLAFTDKDMIKRKDGNHIITKKEYGAYIGHIEEFKKYMLNVAVKAGYGRIKKVVIIADGATWIRNACEDIFPDAIQILDKFHLEENLFEYARYKFGENKEAYIKWAKNIMKDIEDGNIKRALKTLEKENYDHLPKTVPNILGYVKNNRNKIDYPAYKEAGYFVGSGAIESGIKVVIHRRLKQAGMRWSVAGGQYIATLRSKAASCLWNEVDEVINAA
jgi:hypothetical protein